MSRGIRDLRDLICVSRLTIRDSDEEIFSSDNESVGGHRSQLSKGSLSNSMGSRGNSAAILRENQHSSDSGIGTTNQSPQESQENVTAENIATAEQAPHPPLMVESDIPRALRSKRKKKRKPKVELDHATLHDLPKSAPLPPVTQLTHRRSMVDSSESVYADRGLRNNQVQATLPAGNFDNMLTFIDANLLSEWLELSNRNVTALATFCHAGENFVQFAHFWLSQFPDHQKHEIFRLEHSIVMDNLGFAFALGQSSGAVKPRDISRFMTAIFREYPAKLLSVKGPHLFLDYLDVLSSERQDAYKKVLSDVKCSTRVKCHAQWTLGLRSYALVSVWTAVINFYRKFLSDTGADKNVARPVPISAVNKNNPYEVRMYQAIRNGYADVVNYILKSGQVHATMKDLDNKGLIFTAVMHNQPKVLKYLLKHVKPELNLNDVTATGNTALHAVANNGNVEVAALLLAEPSIEVNVRNTQCDDATPLHLAVMHGHVGVAELLLKAGADCALKMGDLSAVDIARDFDHTAIHNLLTSEIVNISEH